MAVASLSLPENPDELRAFAAALRDRYEALEQELYPKTLHIEKLKMQLAVLRRARFGRSSEKPDRQIEQLELALGELEESKAQSAAVRKPLWRTSRAKRRRSFPRRRKGFPCASRCRNICRASVSSIRPLVFALLAAEPGCIGTDEREVLEYVPSHFNVVVHARPKMSCRNCETITQPPLPSLPIEVACRDRACSPMCSWRVLRSPAAAPPVRYLCPERRRSRTFDACRLGGAYGLSASALGRRRSARMCGPGTRCMPMIRRCRYSIPAAARPKPAGYGLRYAMNDPGARRCRRLCITSILLTEGPPAPKRCCADATGISMPMPMQDSTASTKQIPGAACR